MATTIYTARLPWGETLTISADLSQASAQITYRDGKEWIGTPFQTADARHNEINAVRLILDYFGPGYYREPDDDREPDDVLDEIMDAVSIDADDD